jgi:hypothetical protein
VAGVNIHPSDSFKAMTMLCLLLRGELSDILTMDIMQRMKKAKPDLELLVPGRGHAQLLTEPEVHHRIGNFLSCLIDLTLMVHELSCAVASIEDGVEQVLFHNRLRFYVISSRHPFSFRHSPS